ESPHPAVSFEDTWLGPAKDLPGSGDALIGPASPPSPGSSEAPDTSPIPAGISVPVSSPLIVDIADGAAGASGVDSGATPSSGRISQDASGGPAGPLPGL